MSTEIKPSPSRLESMEEPASCFKPRLTQLLESLCLDVTYEQGRGNSLFYRDEHGQRIEVLDLVGGYGSLLLGHSHPALVTEAVKLLTSERPVHVQGSVRFYAQRLAAELSRRAGGGFNLVLANSGTEAVEAAMKHAILETGCKNFIALEGAFHGKSLGALQLTANPEYRASFALAGLGVVRVPPNNFEALEAAFARTSDLAGFIYEPIQGEGGVRPLEPAFCQRAAQLCAGRDIPLIADECQTGLGRTGAFLASEWLGVRPDYVLLSKALGGGLAKISAVLIARERYVPEFDLKQTSTYADDDFSCGLALRTLELLDPGKIAVCAELGNRLIAVLRDLAQRYPDVIADVRGRGLMLGLELRKALSSRSMLLRFLSTQEDLGFCIVAYLLNVHRIRVAPTLSDRLTLRFEPSLLLEQTEIDRLRAALEDVCERVRQDDALGLTSFLAKAKPLSQPPALRSDGELFAYDAPRFWRKANECHAPKVAWLCHLVDSDDLISLEAAFGQLPSFQRERYLERFAGRAWPIAMGGTELISLTGKRVWFCPILLPFTSQWVKRQLDNGRLELTRGLVQKGIDAARTLGCQVVALGQYTSIVTGNGTRVDPLGLGVTTGNSYALALAIQALARAQKTQEKRPEDATLVIVGAVGNIGRAAAELLAPGYRETILVGRNRPGSLRRLQELARRMPRCAATIETSRIREGHAAVVATNAVDAPLGAVHFREHAIVCDVSVPGAIASETASLRPDLQLIQGGIAALPNHEDLEIVGFPLPVGQVYGCMAEGMLLALENIRDSRFTGAITSEHVRQIAHFAEVHGFELAGSQGTDSRARAGKEGCYAVA
jgi:acetylornithine/succinyldiaminopimelate/putrescine aminotransferase/predicted amino acid dehydrogenase